MDTTTQTDAADKSFEEILVEAIGPQGNPIGDVLAAITRKATAQKFAQAIIGAADVDEANSIAQAFAEAPGHAVSNSTRMLAIAMVVSHINRVSKAGNALGMEVISVLVDSLSVFPEDADEPTQAAEQTAE